MLSNLCYTFTARCQVSHEFLGSKFNRAPPNYQLLRLPSDIRKLIFEFAMSPSIGYRRLDSSNRVDLLSVPIPSSNINMLVICSELRDDATSSFYKQGHFILGGYDTKEVRQCFNNTGLARMTALEISYSRYDKHEPLPFTVEEVMVIPPLLLPKSYDFFRGLSQNRFPAKGKSDLKLFRAWDIKSSIICALPALDTLKINLSMCTYGRHRNGTEWVLCRLVCLHTVRLLDGPSKYPAIRVGVKGVSRPRFNLLQQAMKKYGSGGIKLSYGEDGGVTGGIL